MISIENGTIKLSEGVYRYDYSDVSGTHSETFTASQTPQIGDSIDAGVLVPLVGYKINHDVSKWVSEDWDTWPKRKAI